MIPAGWWENEAPEGLRQIAGPDPPQPVELYQGEPRMWASYEVAEAARFEPIDEYLERLRIDRKTLRRTI